jgi:CubicO group peptidase (beta-lactamase class C family)
MRSVIQAAVTFCVLVAAVVQSGFAQTGVPAAREQVQSGFSTSRLARIDSLYESMVRQDQLAGAVILVLRDGQPVYERAFGWADRAARVPMTTDAIFRIASQTKAVTSVAAMMLVEEGRVLLNDPVSRFIPAFARTTVAVQTDTGRAVVPARRQITVRDLLTHTAGISYGTAPLITPLYEATGLGPAAGFGWYTADKDEPVCDTMERLATLPFSAQPGEQYVYGYATDVLGCVVERASGMALDRFIETRITRPLDMRDTHFFLPPEKAARLVTVHMRGADGALQRAVDGSRGQGHYVVGPRRSFAGGAGLLSTVQDYARFLQMLLNGGELNGVRILGPRTVDLMTSNQVGTLFSQDGEGFSLGFRTVERTGARGSMASVGTYDWGGAYGTQYLVDPLERLIILSMVQELPGFSGSGGTLRLSNLVYQALVESNSARR